ncbi:MAG: winged helix-turn-helix domain-containing protein [Actinomycetota bacterium]|nr:winged helix-turn-helix domain-containing protein [Actinomycetota bacterium]
MLWRAGVTASRAELAAGPVLDALPYGVVVTDAEGSLVGATPVARALLPRLGTDEVRRCSDLFLCRAPGGPCENGCLAQRAAGSRDPLPEMRIDTAGDSGDGAVWVTSAPLREPPGAILHLRPGQAADRRRRSEPHWVSGPELRICALGRTHVESRGDSLSGEWLNQRPGQVLKYLVCHRRRSATADEIAESIWPNSGQEALSNTRHVIHRLRDKLEPARRAHTESSFILSTAGGYALDRRRIQIDADEFECAVEEGSAAIDRLDAATATEHLERAVKLYRGEFLADEPYADWAAEERVRLSGRAEYALRVLIVLAFERSDAQAAVKHLERLSQLEPYDSAVHREFIMTLLWLGRRSEAKRRYAVFSKRMRGEFGEDPDFDLKSLISEGPARAQRLRDGSRSGS